MTLSTIRTNPGRRHFARALHSTHAANVEIQALMAMRGVTPEVMAEGQQYHDTAAQAADDQALAAGAYHRACRCAEAAEQAAHTAYQDFAQTLKEMFSAGASERAELGLRTPTPEGADHFLGTAHTLFNNAMRHDRIASALAQRGYPQMELERGRGLIVAYEEALRAQAAAKSAAMQATDDQRAAHAAMWAWVKRYVTAARIALRGRPDLQRLLGIERKRRRKRPAVPAPAASEQAADTQAPAVAPAADTQAPAVAPAAPAQPLVA